MKFCVIYQQTSHNAQSPVRVVEQTTGREVGWINRYLDREYVRRLANTTLCTYAYNLLHFIRWWESVHYTGDIREGDLTESTLLDYVRFQSSQQPRPSPSTINDRVVVAVHVSTVACTSLSHTAPAGDGGPAMRQPGPPTVNRRIAVAGSTT